MKKEISSIELRQIVDEMQFLVGSRLDKIIQNRDDFYINFYVRAKGNCMLRILPGKYAYMTKSKPSGSEASVFCLSLRKYLSNTFLSSISQIEPERILKIVLEKNEQKFILFIELFAKGNIILCDDKEMIMLALESQKWKDRTVMVNRQYKYPKKDINLFNAKADDVSKLALSKADSLVKALATDFGLGGIYAEEICIVANVDKNMPPKRLSDADIHAIYKALMELLGKKPEPRAIIKDGKVINIVPYDLDCYESCEFEAYVTYNEALDEILSKERMEEIGDEHSKAYIKKLESINSIIEKQQKALEEAKKTIEENQRKGEIIYENYALIKEIIDELNKAKEKYSWKEIKEKLKGHKTIKSINEKEKKVVIEI